MFIFRPLITQEWTQFHQCVNLYVKLFVCYRNHDGHEHFGSKSTTIVTYLASGTGFGREEGLKRWPPSECMLSILFARDVSAISRVARND